MTHQARLHLAALAEGTRAAPGRNEVRVALGGIVTLRDRAGRLGAAQLGVAELLELETTSRAARLHLEGGQP